MPTEVKFNRDDIIIFGRETSGLPDIFTEKKSFIAELDEEVFEKIIEFRYMPIRKEYIELPPFEILDVNLDKIYLIFFTNKIYVNE